MAEQKNALYENDNVTLKMQVYLLFSALSIEIALCHLLAAGVIYMTNAGVTGLSMTLPTLATMMVGVTVLALNIATLIISVRILWLEKNKLGWEPLAKVAFPAVLIQTSFMIPVWLFYNDATIQFTIGSAGLFFAGIFFTLFRRLAHK